MAANRFDAVPRRIEPYKYTSQFVERKWVPKEVFEPLPIEPLAKALEGVQTKIDKKKLELAKYEAELNKQMAEVKDNVYIAHDKVASLGHAEHLEKIKSKLKEATDKTTAFLNQGDTSYFSYDPSVDMMEAATTLKKLQDRTKASDAISKAYKESKLAEDDYYRGFQAFTEGSRLAATGKDLNYTGVSDVNVSDKLDLANLVNTLSTNMGKESWESVKFQLENLVGQGAENIDLTKLSQGGSNNNKAMANLLQVIGANPVYGTIEKDGKKREVITGYSPSNATNPVLAGYFKQKLDYDLHYLSVHKPEEYKKLIDDKEAYGKYVGTKLTSYILPLVTQAEIKRESSYSEDKSITKENALNFGSGGGMDKQNNSDIITANMPVLQGELGSHTETRGAKYDEIILAGMGQKFIEAFRNLPDDKNTVTMLKIITEKAGIKVPYSSKTTKADMEKYIFGSDAKKVDFTKLGALAMELEKLLPQGTSAHSFISGINKSIKENMGSVTASILLLTDLDATKTNESKELYRQIVNNPNTLGGTAWREVGTGGTGVNDYSTGKVAENANGVIANGTQKIVKFLPANKGMEIYVTVNTAPEGQPPAYKTYSKFITKTGDINMYNQITAYAKDKEAQYTMGASSLTESQKAELAGIGKFNASVRNYYGEAAKSYMSNGSYLNDSGLIIPFTNGVEDLNNTMRIVSSSNGYTEVFKNGQVTKLGEGHTLDLINDLKYTTSREVLNDTFGTDIVDKAIGSSGISNYK